MVVAAGSRPPNLTLELAGTGESGKSTLIKQMRRAYDRELSPEECAKQKTTIHGNIITAMSTLVQACIERGITISCEVRHCHCFLGLGLVGLVLMMAFVCCRMSWRLSSRPS